MSADCHDVNSLVPVVPSCKVYCACAPAAELLKVSFSSSRLTYATVRPATTASSCGFSVNSRVKLVAGV